MIVIVTLVYQMVNITRSSIQCFLFLDMYDVRSNGDATRQELGQFLRYVPCISMLPEVETASAWLEEGCIIIVAVLCMLSISHLPGSLFVST